MPKPLFIRANEGDCLNIMLTNRLPAAGTTLASRRPDQPGRADRRRGARLTSATWSNGVPTTVAARLAGR